MAAGSTDAATVRACVCETFDIRCHECSKPLLQYADPPVAADLRMRETCDTMCRVLRRMYATLKAWDDHKAEEFARSRDELRVQMLAVFDSHFAQESAIADARLERAQYRTRVLNEIRATEADYLKDLELMQNVWAAELTKAAVLAPAEMQLLFAPIPRLIMLSEELHRLLAEACVLTVGEQRIGKEFKAKVPFINVYIEYCASQMQPTDLLNSVARNSKLRDVLERIRVSSPELRKLDLSSFVAKPMQRVTKYPLFFKDLLKYTEHDHPDYQSISEVITALEGVLKKINTRTRERETMLLLNKLQPAIIWRGTALDLMLSKSQVLKFDAVKVTAVINTANSTRAPANTDGSAPRPPSLPSTADKSSSLTGLPASPTPIAPALLEALEAHPAAADSPAALRNSHQAAGAAKSTTISSQQVEKANWAGLFNNIFLVCRAFRDRFYEVAAFPIKGINVSESLDGLSLFITHPDMPEEISMTPKSPSEKLLWNIALQDAIKNADSAPPIKFQVEEVSVAEPEQEVEQEEVEVHSGATSAPLGIQSSLPPGQLPPGAPQSFIRKLLGSKDDKKRATLFFPSHEAAQRAFAAQRRDTVADGIPPFLMGAQQESPSISRRDRMQGSTRMQDAPSIGVPDRKHRRSKSQDGRHLIEPLHDPSGEGRTKIVSSIPLQCGFVIDDYTSRYIPGDIADKRTSARKRDKGTRGAVCLVPASGDKAEATAEEETLNFIPRERSRRILLGTKGQEDPTRYQSSQSDALPKPPSSPRDTKPDEASQSISKVSTSANPESLLSSAIAAADQPVSEEKPIASSSEKPVQPPPKRLSDNSSAAQTQPVDASAVIVSEENVEDTPIVGKPPSRPAPRPLSMDLKMYETDSDDSEGASESPQAEPKAIPSPLATEQVVYELKTEEKPQSVLQSAQEASNNVLPITSPGMSRKRKPPPPVRKSPAPFEQKPAEACPTAVVPEAPTHPAPVSPEPPVLVVPKIPSVAAPSPPKNVAPLLPDEVRPDDDYATPSAKIPEDDYNPPWMQHGSDVTSKGSAEDGHRRKPSLPAFAKKQVAEYGVLSEPVPSKDIQPTVPVVSMQVVDSQTPSEPQAPAISSKPEYQPTVQATTPAVISVQEKRCSVTSEESSVAKPAIPAQLGPQPKSVVESGSGNDTLGTKPLETDIPLCPQIDTSVPAATVQAKITPLPEASNTVAEIVVPVAAVDIANPLAASKPAQPHKKTLSGLNEAASDRVPVTATAPPPALAPVENVQTPPLCVPPRGSVENAIKAVEQKQEEGLASATQRTKARPLPSAPCAQQKIHLTLPSLPKPDQPAAPVETTKPAKIPPKKAPPPPPEKNLSHPQ